ncbi:TIGR03088 family PEP-CTERM/XrtA system glycosyltransferase [Allochromatium palmeri]|uniref:TIGR03088 family PEP-CTERM/XrtA system glycosyltransferase n=1 Tax=Allochromatium palmeri TaxID=231048 RepID=A0A6N8EFA4_9GAMM|nr:TIGR03088 family PEP-CTERM/XrtA system glycosyltransferase [Allochromatium palmeri]MTW21758.1 TIGR03088 family PEP-CTERM/XrtA system glycosyltransferase [Allochromatium palmeri]
MIEPSRQPEVNAAPALVVHIIYRLDVGGLENGLVNLINRLPPARFRHAIICLDDYDAVFRQRLQVPVEVYALHKRAGQDFGLYVRLWRLLRRLRPAIVHTRNLSALESQLPAWLAGVRGRVHGEHGRDVHDLDNTSRKYRWLRQAFRPLVRRYIPLSRDLASYLIEDIGVSPARIATICNGVDLERFHPCADERACRAVLPAGFAGPEQLVIGTIGRLEQVKDQMTLARAFAELVASEPDGARRLRLVMVGDGSQRDAIAAFVRQSGLDTIVWMAGTRNDVPECLRAFDLFVLPSLGEGISNTILEAMGTGLPVIATAVGGNGELVEPEATGYLVPRADPSAIAERLRHYGHHPAVRAEHAHNGRQRAERDFSLTGMVERYAQVYADLLDE